MTRNSIRKVITNNIDRRSGIDRRQFSYTKHIPERRTCKDRRSGIDRIVDRVEYDIRS